MKASLAFSATLATTWEPSDVSSLCTKASTSRHGLELVVPVGSVCCIFAFHPVQLPVGQYVLHLQPALENRRCCLHSLATYHYHTSLDAYALMTKQDCA